MQKRYPFEKIESLIHAELAPDLVKQNPPTVLSIANYLGRLSEQKTIIRTVLVEEVFGLDNEKSIEILIQRYQAALINFADDITQYISITDASPPLHPQEGSTVITVYRYALNCIEELLTVIEKHFSRYFNIDEKIPDSYKLLMQSEFRMILVSLISEYENTDIEEELLLLMIGPFRKFIEANNVKPFTYRQLLYLKTLQKEFAQYLVMYKNADISKNIRHLLLYSNFNSYAFFSYCISIISKNVKEANSIINRLERLAWWLKTISQVLTKPGVAYRVKDQSAKDQLLGWIYDEMAFIEKKQQLTIVFPPQPGSAGKTPLKITTALSVKQLALMTRLFFDNGIIKHENQTELLTQMAAVIKTEKKENISAGNLRIKYYDIDQSTKNIVKDHLIKMTNQLHKY